VVTLRSVAGEGTLMQERAAHLSSRHVHARHNPCSQRDVSAGKIEAVSHKSAKDGCAVLPTLRRRVRSR